MPTSPQQAFRDALRARVAALYQREPPEFAIEFPPSLAMGDLATPIAFELARPLKRAPRQIAAEIVEGMPPIAGIVHLEIAGGGYINAFFDRPATVALLLGNLEAPRVPTPGREKVIVEHTNINPNKAAHVGHLRNAVLGDTLVRLLRHAGTEVEVHNYIDDTGVQVADLVVGFIHLLGARSIEDIERVAENQPRFDYFCWDLYARVTQFYEDDKSREALRAETLKKMEEREGVESDLAQYLAPRIVKCHLATMARIGVGYDLLPWESHIIGLRFWARAFELLRGSGAIRHEEDGDRAGCWVMDLPPAEGEQPEEPKIIVRSNGTVTYVGKDIAYQLWKTGLLGIDFNYRLFEADRPEGSERMLWSTCIEQGAQSHPPFGRADRVYNVIDVRQSYLQRVVQQGLRALGHQEQAERSHHFAYEMVALSAACARALGIPVDDERAHVGVSGRKGYGVKADDLIDALIDAAHREVLARDPAAGEEAARIASRVAVGALRYFMVKYTRNKIIAFDLEEVLSFEGETGPYLLYSAVRARNIFNKMAEREGFERSRLGAMAASVDFSFLTTGPTDDHWELVALMSRFDETVHQAIRSLEPSIIARYAFLLAQTFNHFYHQFPVMQEADPNLKAARVLLTHMFLSYQSRALELMGIEVPQRM